MGHDVDLDCTIEANPPAVIVWIKDGVELSNKEHYKYIHIFKCLNIISNNTTLVYFECLE